MLDWQTIAVALIVLGALAYTARRGLSRLRSFRAGGRDDAATCATGCGSCGSEKGTAGPARALVQISPKPTTKNQGARR